MKVLAHRGFAAEAPENTVVALERAAGLADAVEVDVRRCGSGEPVVIHDEAVDRVTGSAGAVADFDLAELRDLSVLDSGAGVPSLAEVVDALPPETELFVELKESGIAADALAVLADHRGRTVVTSFSSATVAEVRDVDPSVPRGLIAGRLRDDPAATARELGCTALLLRWPLVLRPRTARSVRSTALETYAWTVRRRSVARLLARWPLDGLIVDGNYPA